MQKNLKMLKDDFHFFSNIMCLSFVIFYARQELQKVTHTKLSKEVERRKQKKNIFIHYHESKRDKS